MPLIAPAGTRLFGTLVAAAVVSSSLLVVPAAAQDAAPAESTAVQAATTLDPVPARPADLLVDSYGVAIHPTYGGTPYTNRAFVLDKLRGLGVRHVRTAINTNRPDLYRVLSDLAAAGIRSNLIMGKPNGTDTPQALVNTVATQLPAGSVVSLEGANEWNLSGDPDWVANLRAHQAELYRAAKAEPRTASLPVLAPALGMNRDFAVLGDVSAMADLGNNHLYPGGMPPSSRLDGAIAAEKAIVGGKPLIFTETGYHNAYNTADGHHWTPEPVVGVYAPRLLLEQFSRGIRRTFTYELVDQKPDLGKTDHEANFGLVRNDLTVKPVYTAMQNLLRLANDPGPAFTPGALPYTLEEAPADVRQVLLQKRDGRFYLLLWRDVSVYDRTTQQTLTVAPQDVTVQLGTNADITVHRPSTSPAPVSSTTGVHSLTLPMAGEVVALEIAPTSTLSPPSAPRAVAGEPAAGSASVAWTPPAFTGGRPVTGYRVQAQPGGATVVVPATARTTTVSGLPNGTAHTFTVTALNDLGASVPSRPSPPVVPHTVPTRPTDVTAVPGRASAVVSWDVPASDGGAAVTGWTVALAPDGPVVQLPATARSTTLTGLTNGTTYTATVTATNRAGSSAPSAPATVTPRTVTSLPQDVVATPGDGSAVVSWGAPLTDGGAAVTRYRVVAYPGENVTWVDGGAQSTVVDGLANGTSYAFRVAAVNPAGDSGLSAASLRVTPRTVPGAPVDVAAAPRNGGAVVTWEAPAWNGGSPLTGFRVEASPGDASVTTGPGARSILVPGLANGTSYSFVVVAQNVAGTSVASAPSAATTPRTVPTVPLDVTALPRDGAAVLGWDAPASDGGSPVTGYRVESSSGATMLLGAGARSATVTGLDNGTAYTFRVIALNQAGESAAAGTRTTPRTVPTAPLEVSGASRNGAAVVTWTAPLSDGGSPVTGYRVVSSGGSSLLVGPGVRSTTVGGLTNGVGYTFTVVALNAAGESPVSAASPVVVPAVPPVVVEERALRYGGWRVVTADGTRVRVSRTAGDTATFSFTGTAVTWRTETGPDEGIALVRIDGVSRGEVDLYRSTAGPRLVSFTGLPAGTHSVQIEVLGRKAAASTAADVAVDGFTVGTTTSDEASPAIAWSGWSATTGTDGSTAYTASAAGRSAGFSFTGHTLEWVTVTGPGHGLAEVVIDGVSRGTVDLSAATVTEGVRRVYAGLGAGTHAVTIKVLGTRGARGTGTQVAVDALVVHTS